MQEEVAREVMNAAGGRPSNLAGTSRRPCANDCAAGPMTITMTITRCAPPNCGPVCVSLEAPEGDGFRFRWARHVPTRQNPSQQLSLDNLDMHMLCYNEGRDLQVFVSGSQVRFSKLYRALLLRADDPRKRPIVWPLAAAAAQPTA